VAQELGAAMVAIKLLFDCCVTPSVF